MEHAQMFAQSQRFAFAYGTVYIERLLRIWYGPAHRARLREYAFDHADKMARDDPE